MENVFTTFFDLSKKGQENSVNYANCVNCVKPLNYQTLPSKNETEEREGYYERTARPVGKSRITSTRPGLNQYKTPITKMLQHVAMIFAVLVMSMANVGVVWGASPYDLDITSYAWGGTGTKSANDGTVTISGYIQAKTYNNTGSTKVAFLDGSNYLTVSATSACITSITVTANTDNNSNAHEIAYQTSADGSSWSAITNIGTCANRQSAPTSRTANFSPAVRYVRFTKGGSNSMSVGAISVTYSSGVTHTVTAATEDEDKGTAAAGSATVVEGATTTITATPKSGYKFDHWTVSGTGATLSSTSTNPTTLTMGTANATVTAYFVVDPCSAWGYGTANTTAPSSGNSVTVGDLTVANVGCSTNSTTPFSGGTSTGVILGNGASKYITGTLGGDEIASIRFSIYTTSSSNTTYVVAFSSSATYDAGTVLKVSGDYTAYFYDDAPEASGTRKDVEVAAPAGAKSFAIGRNLSGVSHGGTEQNSGSRGVYYIAACPADAPSCTAPNHVDVEPTNADGWRYSLGETISLTATAYSSAGKGSPITSGLTYQWQKYISSTWTDINTGTNPSAATATLQIANCSEEDGGAYRCKVSTGTGCETISDNGDGYFVRVFTLYGGYSGQSYGHHKITWTSTYRGTVTINLNASSSFKFKFTDNDGKWYGNTGTIAKDFATENDAEWGFGTGSEDATLTTGGYGAGEYVLTVDITHFDDGGSKYVNLRSVVYPKKTTYLQLCSDWKADSPKFAIYYWKDGDNGWSDFMTAYACDGEIRYADIPVWATNAFFVRFNPAKTSTGNFEYEWSRSGDNESTLPTDGKDYYHSLSVGGNGKYYGSWGTYSAPTYTVTTAISPSGYGTVSEASVSSVACETSISASTNTLTVGATNVTATPAAATAEYTYAFDNWTWTPAGATVTSDVTATANFTRTPKSYTLTWTTDGDALTGDYTKGTVAYGTAIVQPNTPTKTGYNFSAWSPSVASTMPAANTTYTATFTAKTYNITLDRNGASSGSESATMTYNSSSHTAITPPVKAGYTFDGWYDSETDNNGSGNLVMNASGVLQENVTGFTGAGGIWTKDATCTLYAKWTAAPAPAGDCEDLFVCTATSATACTATTGSATYNIASSGGGECSIGGYSYYIKPNSSNVIVATPKDGSSFAAGDSLIFVVYNPNATAKTMGFVLASSTTEYTHEVAAGKLHYFRQKLVAADISGGKVTFDRKSGDDRWIGVTIKHCETASCTTPAAPTSPTNGATAATTQVVNWTDGSNDKWDVYVSTSSSTPAGGVTPTASGLTAKTYTFTGLTASTDYYWWVRSVCDATHKSDWVAGSPFTTSAAATYTVTYNGSSADDGGSVPVDASSPYTSGSTVTVLGNTGSLTRTISGDAATFYGWNTNSNMYGGTHYNAGGTFSITANTTLYAVWGYEITWNLNDGDWVDYTAPNHYIYGQGLTLPAAAKISKSGYTFDHWELGYDNSTITAIADDATGNVTLNAIWTAAASSYSVTYNGNDNTGGSVPTDDTSYSAGDIVTVKGNTGSLVKTGQTFLGWSTSATASSGTFYPAGYKFEMPASNVTLYAVWGSAAEEKYYYGHVKITDGALVKEIPSGATQFFTNSSGVIANSTAISLTSTPSVGGIYYNSNTLTDAELSKSSNWGTSSGSKRYIRGLKFANGTTYTLALGSKTATSIKFYGWSGGTSKTLTIGGVGYESPSTKEKFFSHEFTKSGNFTNNVSITQDGDFYGILVITISTGAASNFTVSFNMNGHGSAIDAIANVPSGSKIGKPIPDPTAVDWEFGGWYNEAGCSSEWNFATGTITANKTLYAKWTNCAPTITTPPVAASYAQNATATALTVAANDNGGGELHYQWWVKENDLDEETGSAIPGETGTSFTPSTTLLGTTYYYCVVSNDCGNVFSSTAGITITDARPNPKANWDVAVPTHGGKGFSFSVEVNKNDGSNWDGTLTADMLSVSSEAVLGTVTVDNTAMTIRGTYGVKGSATSPVTFYLLLPATETQAAARLDYDKTFSTCTGGGDGSTYRVPVRKDSEKDASNNYRWVTAGAGEISYTYGSTISSGKAASSYNSFDSIVSSDKQNLYVRTYNANIKKVTLYVLTGGKDITVESIYKQTSYKGADDKDKLSTAAYSVTYDDGSDENTGAKGNHYIVITLEDPLEANDILMFTFSKNNVKAYGAVFTQTADGGTETPTLGWSPSIDENVEKNENAADFTYTATRSNDEAVASLGIISYSSSNTTVATVNATTGQVTIADNIDFGSANHIDVTITATLSASGCYQKATTTYTLRVKKYVCTEAAGTVTVTSESGCGKVLTISGYEEDASIQWYKDGEAITGATKTSYTATSGGTYYAITHKGCDAVSNELTISTAAATATKIVDEWYVKNGRRTPDIALVQTKNATGFTVTNKSDGATVSDIGGCTFKLKEDGIIYLHGTKANGDAPSDMTDGDITIRITATACSNATPLDIVLHIQPETAKPEIAFVVDGTLRKDGGTATSVLAAKTSERPIWEYLSAYYQLTGCNAYWSVNSKELRQYYSQFDAILITDDPNTSTEGTGGVSYVKAFGTMVDVRPVLTLEAYVGKFKDGGWHVYDATPSSPNPRQVEMKLECKNHDIFAGLNPSTMDNVRTETINGDEYWFVTMVDTTQSPYHNTKDDYEALPALQGFDKTKFSNMLGVGTIKNDELQAGVERQEEPAARMMILGIQNNAMAALTTEGKMVVKNALDYLLKTDMEDVNDCSNYFTDASGDHLWNNLANWTGDALPDFETRARILRPVVVPNDYSARVARVDIASDGPSKKLGGAECTGSLTISPLGALVVSGKVSRVHAPYYGVNDLMPTRVSDVAILSGTGGNGTLIMDDASGENKAYVQMYSKAVKGSPTTWQYIGIPHSDVGNAMDNYYDSWLYSWSPSAGWEVVPRGAAVTPWTGYCITYPTFGHTYEMEGTLVATADVDIDVPANSYQIIGNSWVAPIQIENFEDDDFGDITKTVYFFNTGSDTDGSGTVSGNATGGTRWAADTYVAVPIHMAEYTGEDKIIPSMQGFYVANEGSAGTLHLDYDKLVRQRGVSNYIQGQMHAPRRIAKGSNDPVMLKMIVRGSRYDDRLIVAEREDFTKGHDDGWDGAKWDGSTISPTIWSQNENGGVEAVTATPDMEGTIIGFRAGEDNEYTFHFEYDDMAEALYLLDTELNIYTRILTGETYTFHCADKGEHNRFILTRKAPQITTGCEQVGADGVKAMKFIKDNKMYILLNGILYDATGKMMK